MTDQNKKFIRLVQSNRLSSQNQSICNSEISETESDITMFVKEFRKRIQNQLDLDNEGDPFLLLDEMKNVQSDDDSWLHDNQLRFFKDTPHEKLVAESYLSELGYMCSITYSPDGDYIVTGHSTGLIQVPLSNCFNLFFNIHHLMLLCCWNN